MRRLLVILLLLAGTVGGVLAWRLREQSAWREGPAGGTGTIEGVEVDVVARLSTRIQNIWVQEGEIVRAGQRLVDLDCAPHQIARDQAAAEARVVLSELQSAEAAVRVATISARGLDTVARSAQHVAASVKSGATSLDALESSLDAEANALLAQWDTARKQEHRTTKLRSGNVVTDSDVDDVAGRVKTLDFRVQSVKAKAHQVRGERASAVSRAAAADADAEAAAVKAEAARVEISAAVARAVAVRHRAVAARAAVRRVELDIQECDLVAPRGGVVMRRSFEPGEAVVPGTRVLTLVDDRDARATFYLPNVELAHAVPGREVAVTADAYPGEIFRGRILWVAPRAEFTPRTIQTREDRDRLVYAVKIAVGNDDHRLRPGMPVEVTIPGTRHGPPPPGTAPVAPAAPLPAAPPEIPLPAAPPEIPLPQPPPAVRPPPAPVPAPAAAPTSADGSPRTPTTPSAARESPRTREEAFAVALAARGWELCKAGRHDEALEAWLRLRREAPRFRPERVLFRIAAEHAFAGHAEAAATALLGLRATPGREALSLLGWARSDFHFRGRVPGTEIARWPSKGADARR